MRNSRETTLAKGKASIAEVGSSLVAFPWARSLAEASSHPFFCFLLPLGGWAPAVAERFGFCCARMPQSSCESSGGAGACLLADLGIRGGVNLFLTARVEGMQYGRG